MKNPIFKGVFTKKQYIGGNYQTRGAWAVCRFKVGRAWRKRGGGVFEGRGFDTPLRIMRIIAVNAAKTISINANFTNPNLD